MPKLYDLSAPNGTYVDRETGEEKTSWIRCGAVIEKANGKKAVKLEALPIEFNGWLNCTEPRSPVQQAAKSAGQPDPYAHPDDPNDSIPF
jgi:sulfur relay (sulfurtransferase) DsrC/TusE family protein